VQNVVQAISEPRRREILRLVRDRELAAGQIASHFEVTRPAISQHLTVLKNAGLVSERREGTRRIYRARPEGLVELRKFLEGFWDESFAQLKHEAEKEERSKKRGRRAERN
jgi:DNA-binding transcriptional ArsR family regulator